MSPNRNLICGLMRYQTTNNMSNLSLTQLKELAESMDRDELVSSLVSLQTKVDHLELQEKEKLETEVRRLKMTCIGMDEQITQNDQWFEEINEILGVDKDEPAVEMVRDYVKKYGKD